MPNPLSHAAQPLSHLGSQPLDGSAPPDSSTGAAHNPFLAEGIAGEGTTSTSTSPPSLPLPPLLRLPPELLSLILSHVPAQQYQRTALALHKVFPTHGLAEEHLWRHIIVRRGEQLQPLWKAARVRRDAARSKMDDQDAERAAWNRARKRRGEDGGSREDSEEESEEDEEDEDDDERRLRLGKRLGTASFAMESWRGDADLLNNALRCLPHVPVMRLNLGTNFAPEHLEEMFEDPRLGMERLEMRFKPYVEQASYYQFLKGSYFDSAIETLTRNWPEVPSFTRLSIVQDLPPRSTAPPTAAHSMAASAMTSAAVSASASALASAATSVAASAVTSPATKPTDLEDKVQALSLNNSTGTANDNGNGNGGGDGHDDGSSTSDGEASDYSTPPTSASDSPVVEVKGYTGHGPFPYLSDKIGWAKPKHFAQPIVFFDINCLAKFGASPAARHLTHLRLRVPSRNIAAVLCGPANGNVQLFPALKYLDISTTNVRLDSTLSMLLKKYECLEHLVLDRVNLFGFQARDKGLELCRELGGTTLSACLARGKERERAIAHWDTAERARIARAQAEAAQRSNGNASNSGAQGSDAEGSLIDQAQREAQAAAEERERQLAIARSRRGHRSAAHSTFSLRDRPSRLRPYGGSAAATTSTGAPVGPLPPSDRLYLVLPPLPALRTLAIGGEALHVSSGKVREWTNEFHAGWREGLGKIAGWAGHVGERYERAKKKADEWVAQESRSTLGNGGGSGTTGGRGKHGKGKAASSASSASSSSASKTAAPSRPPTDVRLYRFPTPGERDAFLASTGKVPLHSPDDPTEGLIEIHPSTLPGGGLSREYLEPYKLAIADAEVHANDYSQPAPCVLCTIPDCEGPRRRGDEGGRVDGRGGMDGAHVRGCGHVVGRETWGWNGA